MFLMLCAGHFTFIVLSMQEFALRALASITAASLQRTTVPDLAASYGLLWEAMLTCVLGKPAERVPVEDLVNADSAALSQKVRFSPQLLFVLQFVLTSLLCLPCVAYADL